MKLNRIQRRTSGPLVLELTPLIDVVFLLLIFFLVATNFKDLDSGIKIDLPTSTVKSIKPVDEIQVVVTKGREYYLIIKDKGKTSKKRVSFNNLKKELKENLQKSKDKNVIISADKNVTHGVIVDVMTASKEAGAVSLDIDTASSGK